MPINRWFSVFMLFSCFNSALNNKNFKIFLKDVSHFNAMNIVIVRARCLSKKVYFCKNSYFPINKEFKFQAIHRQETYFQTTAGANPTIMSYNAKAVKIYNATSSLVRFEYIK
jgi:hypothetical protein